MLYLKSPFVVTLIYNFGYFYSLLVKQTKIVKCLINDGEHRFFITLELLFFCTF